MKAKISVKTIPDYEPQAKPFEVRDTENQGLVLRVQPSGVCTFYAVYRVEGKKQRFKIGNAGQFVDNGKGGLSFKSGIHPDVARTVLREKTGEAAKGNDPQAERKKKRKDEKDKMTNTVGGFFDKVYKPFLEAERKSGKLTQKRIKANFEGMFNKPLADVNPFLLAAWKKKQIAGGKSPITINRDTADLKAMLSKAVELGKIKDHPLAKLKPAKTEDNSRVRYLSPEEETRLFSVLAKREEEGRAARLRFNAWRKDRHLDPLPEIQEGEYIDHLQPLVLLALNTGLRRGELFSLEWRDIDFFHNRLTVRAAAAKGAKPRHIPLNTKARDLLKQWKKQTGGGTFVFPGKEGKRLDNISSSWGKLSNDAELDDFTFHDLRHDFATKTLKAGCDIVTLSKLLGHASLKMTLRYSHVTDDTMTAALDRLAAQG